MAKTKKTNAQASEKELRKEALDLRKELAGLRLEHAQFKLKNTSFMTVTRKKLARVLTQLNTRKEQVNA